MVVDLAVAEEREQTLDLLVFDSAAQADAVNVVDGNENGCFVRNHSQVVKTAGGAEDCLRFDALHDAESVIWVNDLVTNLKCHMSPTESRLRRLGVRATSSSISITDHLPSGNGN